MLNITVVGSEGARGRRVVACALDGSAEVGTKEGRVGEAFSLPVPNPKLWSPTRPYLYDLEVRLLDKERGAAQAPCKKLL